MPNPQCKKLEIIAEILRSIAHPARLKIIDVLSCRGALSVTEIQKRLGISQSLTSQHLAVLRQQNIVTCQKKANVCFYLLRKRVLQDLIPYLQKTCRKAKGPFPKGKSRVIPCGAGDEKKRTGVKA